MRFAVAKGILLFVGLLLPGLVSAQWRFIPVDDGYAIGTTNRDGDQLVLVRAQDDLEFLLTPAGHRARPDTSQKLLVWVDGSQRVTTSLQRVGQDKETILRVEFTPQQKVTFVKRMIEGLTFGVVFEDRERKVTTVRFSLIGFTAAINDLLIASEIGTLDLERLWESHKEKELLCYFTATTAVRAMLHRKDGRSQEQCLGAIGRTGIDMLNEAIPKIVARVYQVPEAQVPLDPRGDKYGIFKDCMLQRAR